MRFVPLELKELAVVIVILHFIGLVREVCKFIHIIIIYTRRFVWVCVYAYFGLTSTSDTH